MNLFKLHNVHRCVFVLLLIIGYPTNAQNSALKQELLTPQEQSIIKIASFTSQGALEKLKSILAEGLDNGLTVNQEKEIVVHLYAYAGFPRSIRGLQTLLEVLKERKAQGINDVRGAQASPITDSREKYARGKNNLEQLIGRPLGDKTAYQKFSPEMDRFLKEHLFADIFERDVLSFKQRELVTISIIASLGGLKPMLRSHYNLSLNVGWQPEQLKAFTQIIATTAGKEKAKSALSILNPILDRLKE